MKIKLIQDGNGEWYWRAGSGYPDQDGKVYIMYGTRSRIFPSREAALQDAKSHDAHANYMRKALITLKEEEIEI